MTKTKKNTGPVGLPFLPLLDGLQLTSTTVKPSGPKPWFVRALSGPREILHPSDKSYVNKHTSPPGSSSDDSQFGLGRMGSLDRVVVSGNNNGNIVEGYTTELRKPDAAVVETKGSNYI